MMSFFNLGFTQEFYFQGFLLLPRYIRHCWLGVKDWLSILIPTLTDHFAQIKSLLSYIYTIWLGVVLSFSFHHFHHLVSIFVCCFLFLFFAKWNPPSAHLLTIIKFPNFSNLDQKCHFPRLSWPVPPTFLMSDCPRIYQKSTERRQKTTGSTAFLWWCLSDRREDCFWKHNSVTRTAVIILSPFLLLFAFWIYQPKLSIVRKKGAGHFQQVTLLCAYAYTNTKPIHEQLGLCFPYSRWYNCTRWLGIKKQVTHPAILLKQLFYHWNQRNDPCENASGDVQHQPPYLLGDSVQWWCGFIIHQDGRVFQDGTGNGNSLLLSTCAEHLTVNPPLLWRTCHNHWADLFFFFQIKVIAEHLTVNPPLTWRTRHNHWATLLFLLSKL